ncbi:PilZ domain-containing protein [Methylobacterium sp. WL69]|uniref:PilZ domain-containing protein n=1 Tax=Methylobacterium sp. WL69 TaxID=2603893 RepID=UPI0011CBD2B4|nr:PilZ domain-containing protein [Methylobacterium sp. WL69]TXM69307.1 PilZ domain-containing protein [Methylobacterium sp. WL69]
MGDEPNGTARGAEAPRAGRRHRVMQQGRIVLGPDTLLPCVVRDLSSAGAKIVLARPVRLPDAFDLVIAAHDLRTVAVRLRWQRGEVAGVRFATADDAAT